MSRPRHFLVIFAVTLGFLIGGAVLGAALAHWCAPNSGMLVVLSFLVFPLSMCLGFPAWLGSAFLKLIFHGSPKQADGPFRRPAYSIPPRSWAFVPVTLGIFLPVAMIAGLVAERLSFKGALLLYCVAGTLYGVGMWRSAKSGFLPFPNEE